MTDCTILARPQPFGDWVRATAPAGCTIRQMLGDAAYSASVSIGGHPVPEKLWDKVKPKAGTEIRIIVFPQGGDGNKVLRAVAMIALTYFTAGIASGAIGTSTGILGTSTISVAGLSGASLAAVVGVVGSLVITPMIGQALEIAE